MVKRYFFFNFFRVLILSIFLVGFLISSSFSQSNEEKLENKLIEAENDSVKLMAYYKLIAYYRKNNPEKQLSYIEEGINYAKEINNAEYLATYYSEYSSYKLVAENLDSALVQIKIAESYLPDVTDVRTNLMVLTRYSDILKKKGDIEGASNKYIEALKIAEKNNDESAKASCYMGLGSLYITQKMFEEGYKYIKKFECQCGELDSLVEPRCLAVAYSNLANYFVSTNNPDSTIIYASKAIELKKKFNNYNGLTGSYNALARAQIQIGDTVSALKNYENSLAAAEVIKHKSEIVSTLLILGDYHLKKKNLKKLEEIYDKISSQIESIKSTRTNIDYYSFLAKYYKLKGNYKKGYEAIEKKQKLVTEYRNETNSTLISDLETKYETDKIKKEKELAEANEKLAKQETELSNKILLFTVVFSVVILLLLIYIFNRLNLIRKKNKQLDEAYLLLEESKKYELAASNLKALKSQMNPHFIFNSLNSIQDLIIKNEKETSYDYIVLFAELVRSSLNNSNNDFIPIEEEIEFLEVYLKLEKLRFGDEFNYELIVNEIDDVYIPSLIIQPFLENALLHGLMHKKGDKKLTIEFKLDKELTCIITDNGVGRKEAKRIKDRRGNSHESFAMNSIKERLELLSERFNNNYEFQVEDLFEYDIPTGTRIILSIPFKEEYYPE